MSFGLSDKTCATIGQILGQYPQIEKAIIYGSRAKGNYKDGSDIDLTLLGQGLEQLLNPRLRGHHLAVGDQMVARTQDPSGPPELRTQPEVGDQ